jgi:hypothetical protein
MFNRRLLSLLSFLKKGFLFLFLIFFAFIKTVDNENICGEIGGSEIYCYFSLTDSDSDEEHVCVQCPCNSMVLWGSPVKLVYELEIEFLEPVHMQIYKVPPQPQISPLFRPPRVPFTPSYSKS